MTVLPGEGLSPVQMTSSIYFRPVSDFFSWPDNLSYCQRETPVIASAMQRATIDQRFDFLGGGGGVLPRPFPGFLFGFTAKIEISLDYKLMSGKRKNVDEYTDLNGGTQQ